MGVGGREGKPTAAPRRPPTIHAFVSVSPPLCVCGIVCIENIRTREYIRKNESEREKKRKRPQQDGGEALCIRTSVEEAAEGAHKPYFDPSLEGSEWDMRLAVRNF